MRKALFAGSFDPVTTGHVEIVSRATSLFDEVLVAIGVNPGKKYIFELEDRLQMLKLSFAALPRVSVHSYSGLTVDFARENGVGYLLRGLRNAEDLEYERTVDMINERLGSQMETVFLLSSPQQVHVSSSLVRQVIQYGGDLGGLVPGAALPYLLDKMQSSRK
jgi:pantetheine-phosphate adenylyltransferase